MRDNREGYEQIKAILDQGGYKYHEIEEEFAFNLPFEGDEFNTEAVIIIDEDYYIIEAPIEGRIPPEKTRDVSWFFALLNARLRMGQFLIYKERSEACFRSTGMFDATVEQFERLLYLTISMSESQLKQVMSIAFGDKNPDEVYKEFFSNLNMEETVEA